MPTGPHPWLVGQAPPRLWGDPRGCRRACLRLSEAATRSSNTSAGGQLGRSPPLRGAWGKGAPSQLRRAASWGGNGFPAALGHRHHTHRLHNTGCFPGPPWGTITHAGTGTSQPGSYSLSCAHRLGTQWARAQHVTYIIAI